VFDLFSQLPGHIHLLSSQKTLNSGCGGWGEFLEWKPYCTLFIWVLNTGLHKRELWGIFTEANEFHSLLAIILYLSQIHLEILEKHSTVSLFVVPLLQDRQHWVPTTFHCAAVCTDSKTLPIADNMSAWSSYNENKIQRKAKNLWLQTLA
jgi:hypothetical protein